MTRTAQSAIILTLLLAPATAVAQGTKAEPPPSNEAKLYEKACYSCHNLGGGDEKGPDLMGIIEKRDRAWLHRFIATPMALRDAGDKDAVQLFNKYAPEEMPDQLLSPDQIEELLELIETHSKSKKKFMPTSGRLARRPTPADVPAGRMLFTGQTRLKNGAGACIDCHSVAGIGYLGGGRLGPDLTDARVRYAEVELASILKSPAFPTMAQIFAKRPLTGDEIVKLYAYIDSAKRQTADPMRHTAQLLAWSALAMLALFGVMSYIWRGRMRGHGNV